MSCWGSNLPPPWETACSPTALLIHISHLPASSALSPFLASAPGTPCSQPGVKSHWDATLTVDPLGTALSRGWIQSLPHGHPPVRLPREAPAGPCCQLSPLEAPQGVAPGVRGAVDGAAIQPARHPVGLGQAQGRGINRGQGFTGKV